MAIYTFRIVGVHYAVNPDSTSREEETELMHQRTAQRLRELDEKRPAVVLIPEPTNPVEARAVMARVEGARIGYVSTSQLDMLHALFQANGGRILKATIESVEARKHGWMNICVETEKEVRIEPQNQCDSPWTEWICTLPELPTIDSRFAQMEAEAMLDDVLSKYPIGAPSIVTQSEAKSLGDIKVDGYVDGSESLRHDAPLNGKHGKESVVDFDLLEQYIRLWLENSLHDLSNEARLMREHYIMQLKDLPSRNVMVGQEGIRRNTVSLSEPSSQIATPSQVMTPQNEDPSQEPLPRIRALVSELEKQRTAICGQKRMNLRVGKWWKGLLASGEMDRLWKTWVARTDGNMEQGVTELVTTLRALPFDLYLYIDDKKTFFSRLHYSGVPRKKYWQIISLMLLRERTQLVIQNGVKELDTQSGCNQILRCTQNDTEKGRQNESFPQMEGGWCNHQLPHLQDEETRNETFTVTIPEELRTPEAKKVLARLQKKGILDSDLQPSTLVGWQKGILAYELTERLEIKRRWVVMATLWKCSDKTLRQNYSKNFNEPKAIDFSKKVKVMIYSV